MLNFDIFVCGSQVSRDFVVEALLDSGASLNFISAQMVERFSLPTQEGPLVTVAVANGERV